jgi:hypothetical protein
MRRENAGDRRKNKEERRQKKVLSIQMIDERRLTTAGTSGF